MILSKFPGLFFGLFIFSGQFTAFVKELSELMCDEYFWVERIIR
jgi:hypothetical protein